MMTKTFEITPESNPEIWAILQPPDPEPELTPDELLALGASCTMAYRKIDEAEEIEFNKMQKPADLAKVTDWLASKAP